jgi:hypothetical protein
MNPDFFKLALEKAENEEDRQAIIEMLLLSKGIRVIDSGLPDVITANKVKNNEKIPKYSSNKLKEINSYSEDVVAFESKLLEDFKKAKTPKEIIRPLFTALKGQLPNNNSLHKYFGKDDKRIIDVKNELIISLLNKMESYLLKHGFLN